MTHPDHLRAVREALEEIERITWREHDGDELKCAKRALTEIRGIASRALESLSGGWQDIETAPKDGARLLLHGDGGDFIDIGEYVQEWREEQQYVRKAKDGDVYKTVKHDNGYWNCEFFPTHWQPLPLPPGAVPVTPEEPKP